MKLTVGKKIGSGFFIVLLLIITMGIFMFWESGRITTDQEICKNQVGTSEGLQATPFYKVAMGVMDEFVISTREYVKETHENYVEDCIYTKIIIVLINISVLFIVASLLISRGNSHSVCEIMPVTSKITDDNLSIEGIKYKPINEIRFSNREIKRKR